ncbi:MAG TPA: SRPBCC domain-containing protein [Candidatus Binataceae bacterium]|nr:SRPBCC domain-containing protein [Candidatus Binataceae bacterium]
MAARSNAPIDPARELTIKRVFDAPRELVFKAWTDPAQVAKWWGPHGFTVVSCKMDLRVAGAWRLCMRSPKGIEDRQVGAFREIVERERLVFTYAFEDEAGKPGHQSIVTVTFADLDGKTAMTLHQAVFQSVAVRDDHVRGWGEALDHLAEYVAQAHRNQRNPKEIGR